jgi:hypothetical protein
MQDTTAKRTAIDHRAVDALIAFWIVKAGGKDEYNCGDGSATWWTCFGPADDEERALANREQVNEAVTAEHAFGLGFTAGVRCAVAVLADPVGNPMPEVVDALDGAKRVIDVDVAAAREAKRHKAA